MMTAAEITATTNAVATWLRQVNDAPSLVLLERGNLRGVIDRLATFLAWQEMRPTKLHRECHAAIQTLEVCIRDAE